MSKLIYITNMSLDGYIEDETGSHAWTNPDQVFEFITELLRPMGTHLYGRRLYETMVYWAAPVESYPTEHRDVARVWQKGEKIVFSRTLTAAKTCNTRIEHEFAPEVIRKLKRESEHVGRGKPAFRTGLRLALELLETRRFGTGVIHVRCRIRGGTS